MSVPRAVRNTLLSVAVLAVLLVGAGVAYTYFLGPDSSTNAASVPAVAPPPADPIGKPPKMAENAKESASIQTLSSPVTPGSNAMASVRTNPGSKCSITVVYNNVPSKDSGLAPKVADEYGTVDWSWTVGSSVPLGTWPVNVSCVYNTRTAVVKGDLVVAKQVEQ